MLGIAALDPWIPSHAPRRQPRRVPRARWPRLSCRLLLPQCPAPGRLPAMYVIDAILKVVGEPYITLFGKVLQVVSPPTAAGSGWRV